VARRKKRSAVYIISVVAHLAAGAALALVPQQKVREIVAIALNEAKPDEKKPEPPKPPEHHESHASHSPAHNSRPVAARAEAAAETQAQAFQDIGLALDSSSADGIAVNIAPAAPKPVPIAVAVTKPKVLVAKRTEIECTEDIVKARPSSMARPSYTDDARRAHVEGRVRIELEVDENGNVTSARILSGLGYGLDEAALEAARHIHFVPATRCNHPVSAPFVIAMRFVLGT
jgi:protein TonB